MPEPAKDKDKSASGSSSTTATPSFASVASPTWSVGKRRRLNWSCPPSSLTDCSSPGAGSDHPEPFVVEIATYSELRAAEQALRDLLLVYLVRGEVANILVLVLRPKGQLRVPDHAHRPGSDGVTALGGWWRVVEL